LFQGRTKNGVRNRFISLKNRENRKTQKQNCVGQFPNLIDSPPCLGFADFGPKSLNYGLFDKPTEKKLTEEEPTEYEFSFF
jgi:hypothetical protein